MSHYEIGEFVVYRLSKNISYHIAIITGYKDDKWWPIFITGANHSANVLDEDLFKIDWSREIKGRDDE